MEKYNTFCNVNCYSHVVILLNKEMNTTSFKMYSSFSDKPYVETQWLSVIQLLVLVLIYLSRYLEDRRHRSDLFWSSSQAAIFFYQF